MLYSTKTILTNEEGRQYVKSEFYPNIPPSIDDEYIITTIGDRLDSLAYSYYRDPELWRVISACNNNITKGSIYPVPGTQLRIVTDINKIKKYFDNFNKAR